MPESIFRELRQTYDEEFEVDSQIRWRTAAMLANVFLSMGILIYAVESAWDWHEGAYLKPNTAAVEYALVTHTLFTVVLLIQLVEFHSFCHFSDQARKETFVGTIYRPYWKRKRFWLEFAICSITPLPDMIFRMNIEWGAGTFFRLYLLLRAALLFSPSYRRRTKVRRLVKEGEVFKGHYAVGLTHVFPAYDLRSIVKALYISHPWICFFLFAALSYFPLSYCIYVREREMQPESFPSFKSSLWYMAVTMTTLGYGSQEAGDVGGRTLSTIASLIGCVILSMVVVVVVNELQYNELEVESMRVAERLNSAAAFKKQAQLYHKDVGQLRRELVKEQEYK